MSRCNVKIRRFAALAGAGATGATLAAIALADPVAHDSSNGVGRESAASIDIAYALAAQPDGKIVAAGLSATSGRNEVALDRYAPDGTLDRSFGTGGRLVTDFRSPNSLATALATQADAKVVVAGYADISASLHGRYEFALARYTRQGTLDLSFGRNGRVLTHFGGRRSSSGVNAVAIQSDGNLVAAGFGSGFALARYTARGTLDRSFGRSGKVVVGLGARNASASALAIEPDGKLIVAGTGFVGGHSDLILARFTARGGLDPTFGVGGRILSEFCCAVSSLVIQRDGKLVVGGTQGFTEDMQFALVRYTADGKLDPGFGSSGMATTDFDPARGEVLGGLAIQQDGKVVAAGWIGGIDKHDATRMALARFTETGSLDPNFGRGGQVIIDFSSSRNLWERQARARAVAVQPNGKIITAGASRGDFALARYTSGGGPDSGFGRGGKITTAFGGLWRTKLASLSATRISGDVLVRWRTACERDARGFNLYREEQGAKRRVNRSPIAASGRGIHAATYSFVDRRAADSIRRYWLEEVTVSGTRRWLRHVNVGD